MAKTMALLFFIAVVLIAAVLWKSESRSEGVSVGQNNEILETSTPETLGVKTTLLEDADSKIYRDDDISFEFRYPESVSVSKIPDKGLQVLGEDIDILIFQEKLGDVDTIHTVAEKHVNKKMTELGENFILTSNISPVAIADNTGLTYTSEEYGREITYFYVPQDFYYLFITNNTKRLPGNTSISLSDEIIYSLKLTQK